MQRLQDEIGMRAINNKKNKLTSFSSTPAQMVKQATESIELFATFSVRRTLFSCNASPSAIPPILPSELKDRSR